MVIKINWNIILKGVGKKMANRNFDTISPSAKAILLVKGYTNIPFARQTAELISYPDEFIPDFSNNDFAFWARVLHFENRYLSIDKLLNDINITNILELSSGFSLRGLDKTSQNTYHYIDTDLPDIISTKKDILDKLKPADNQGTLELLPLNVMDEKQFHQVISHFPTGEIVIVNEGLLMYLDEKEKEKLCKIIHGILSERGGYWITSDIYIQNTVYKLHPPKDTETQKETEMQEFIKKHKIEENKFASFDQAKDFFQKNGFIIDKEAKVPLSKLSSMKYLKRILKLNNIPTTGKAEKIQATWRLRVSK
jgi:O-methyltransferase involved in polyketide biosynthesis